MSLEASIYSFGDFTFDTDQKVLFENGKPVHITPKALHLLSVLVECHGRIVEKEILLSEVWPDSFVEESNLTFNIRQIRKILGDQKGKSRYIETVPRRGYRFVAEVKEGSDNSLAHDGNRVKPDAAPSSPKHPNVLIAASAVLLFALLGLAFVWFREAANTSASHPAGRLTNNGKVTIATITPDGETLIFARKDGVGESLWRREMATGTETRILPADAVEFVGLAVSPNSDLIYYSVFAKNAADLTLSRVGLGGGPPESLSEIESDVSVSFSPDGKKFAYTESHTAVKETLLRTADADGTRPETLLRLKGETRLLPTFRSSPVAWSPDGRVIACAVQEIEGNDTFFKILLVDPRDGSEQYLSDHRWSDVAHIAWKDNEHLALTNADPRLPTQTVSLVSRSTGELSELEPSLKEYEWLSAANGRLFTVVKDTYSSIFVADFYEDLKRPQTKQVYNEPGVIEDIDWPKDGKIFFNSWASGKNEIWQINPDGTKPEQITTNSNLTYGFTVSPLDGDVVFAAAEDRTSNLFIADPNGRNVRQLTEGIDNFRPRFMPDGREVIYEQGSLVKPTIWRVSTETDQPPKQVTGYLAEQPSVSPDGKMIAFQFMDFNGEDRIWRLGLIDSAEGRLLKKIDFPVLITGRRVVWRPGDDLLTMVLTSGENSGFLLLSPTTNAYQTIENVTNGNISSFVWSPDGERLAFSAKHEASDAFLLED